MKARVYHPTLMLLAVTAALSAMAATFEVDTIPTAGLYRIETDAQTSLPGAGSRTQTDNGTNIVNKTTMNGVTAQQTYNKAPTTQCIGTQAEQLAMAAKMGASCPAHTERHGAGGLVVSLQCNGMSTQTTIKRTGETTWVYDIVTSTSGAGAGPNNPQAIMAMKMAEIEKARQMAQAAGQSSGKTPSDVQMAQMKQQMQAAAAKGQQEMDQMPPEKRAALQAAYAHSATGGGMPPMHMQQRYTRIGDSCTPG
ncbi:MAG: hypothetical protein JO142_18525 [Burkholderiales bacterium]|nr:hypothetical protein [Burkholderiales bacterium]